MRYLTFALIAAVAVAGMFLVAAPVDLSAAAAPVALATLAIGGIGFDARRIAAPDSSMIFMAAKTVEELEAELADLLADSQGILDAADENNDGEVSDDDLAKIEANKTKADKLKRQIEARKAVAAPTAQGQGRRTAAEPIENRSESGGGGRRTVAATARDSQRHGFTSMGEFAKAVHAHKLGRVEGDGVQKLVNAATTYGNESTGTDGGFLVPPEFSARIWQKVEAEENLMSRCTELTPSGNSMTLPKDETTPWGTTGIQAYWESEASQATQTKGVFESSTLRLFKLMALAPVTEELLEDAAGFESWIQAKVPGIISHKVNSAIVSGTGAGMPLGILNAPSKVSVAKETSQPADTVWFTNVQKMWARMYAPWRRNAVWIVNQDVEGQLEAMAFQPQGAASQLPTAASTPVYLPPGGIADAPYGRLKGRPVIPLQAAKTIGDQGDIILVDLKQYWILRKASGIRTDTSMHLYFDQAVQAFRFIFRVNGQPAWSSTISPENGSNTLSWAVVLDDR